MSCSHGGTHKHKIPLKLGGTDHLIEDSWFYGEGRYVVQCFLGSGMTIRRNIVRWDQTIAGEPDEPNAAMSNYACADMIWENNISLDYGVPETPIDHCSDICMSTTVDVPIATSTASSHKRRCFRSPTRHEPRRTCALMGNGSPIGATLEHGNSIFRTAFNHDGTFFVTASVDSTAKVWNGKTATQPISGMIESSRSR